MLHRISLYIPAMASLGQASLSQLEQRVVDRLIRSLRAELKDDLVAVWLYGSRARGEQRREGSDVDVFVVTRDGRERDFNRVTDLAMEAAEAEGMNIFELSTQVADPAWVEGRREIESFFMQELDRDKIVLHGSP